MRAKFINELRKGVSGLGALGIGHAAMNRGYQYIMKTWPHILSQSQKDFGLFYPASDEKVPDIQIFIPHVLEIMECSIDEVLIIDAQKLMAEFVMFNWIDNIMDHEDVNIEKKITTKINKLLYDISFNVRYSEEFAIAEVHIESNELRDDGSKIDALDVYHPIFIKYR